ncbi:MAG: hypothetical protein Q7S46_07225 [Gallionella sp.]|nr:hypothetical protein [Gallionella sp.]
MDAYKLCLIVMLLACAAPVQADATHIDAELAASHDNNLARAESAHDIFGDNLLDLGLTATHSMLITPNSGLRFRGGLHMVEHARYTDLNMVSANAGISYRIQPAPGYTAPWIELGAMLERYSFHNSAIRDGRLLAMEAIAGKRLTDRIGARIGISHEQRRADNTNVFEWQRRRMYVMADYKLNLNSTLYASLSRDFGDQVFTTTPDLELREYSKAIAIDPVFGARRAYRMEAIANALELGISTPLNSSSTLDIGLRRFHADAIGGHSYDNTGLRASWLYRFK